MKYKYYGYAAIVIIVLVIVWYWATANSLVVKDEAVSNQWAQVQTQYQRRVDLIPNLVNSAKGYMQFEKELLENITRLRSQWMAATSVQDKVAAATDIENSLSKIMLIVENYPELKSDQTILALMDELAGTENRISVERKRYNDAVNAYNVVLRKFPSSIVAGMMGLIPKDYFEATSSAVPNVQLV